MARPTLREYALTLARAAATRSEDPHRQVGACVLGYHGEVLALGYNGPPPGVDLAPDLWADREAVRDLVIHAEANALRYVRPREALLLATSYHPCVGCLRLIAAQGIDTVVCGSAPSDRWRPKAVYAVANLYGISLWRL